jgi:hypothetical protein
VTGVQTCALPISGLLPELGIAAHREQKLSIKLEIDTNPPAGWAEAVSPVSGTFLFAVRHFDLPSLYATKLHACFFRRFTKGRDFYDLLWYWGRHVTPNYTLLNNAVKQTEKTNPRLGPDNIRQFLAGKIARLDFALIRRDVERFLEDKSELNMLDRNLMLKLAENAPV